MRVARENTASLQAHCFHEVLELDHWLTPPQRAHVEEVRRTKPALLVGALVGHPQEGRQHQRTLHRTRDGHRMPEHVQLVVELAEAVRWALEAHNARAVQQVPLGARAASKGVGGTAAHANLPGVDIVQRAEPRVSCGVAPRGRWQGVGRVRTVERVSTVEHAGIGVGEVGVGVDRIQPPGPWLRGAVVHEALGVG